VKKYYNQVAKQQVRSD